MTRPKDRSGGRGAGAAEEGAEREARGHGVRIGVVLEQDTDAVLSREQVAHLLDADAQQGAVHLGPQDLAHRAPEHHRAHVRVVGQGGRSGALVDDQDGHLGRHFQDRLQDSPQARTAPGPLRSHQHDEVRRGQVRSPVEARIVERAGQRAGVLAGQTCARLTVADQKNPGVRVARGSLKEPEQEVGGAHDDTPHGRTSVYTLARINRSGAVLGQAQGVGQDERHEVVGR